MYSVYIDLYSDSPESEKTNIWLGGYDMDFVQKDLNEMYANFNDMEWLSSLYGRNNFAVNLERIEIFEMNEDDS
jgi:hypothetical protein